MIQRQRAEQSVGRREALRLGQQLGRRAFILRPFLRSSLRGCTVRVGPHQQSSDPGDSVLQRGEPSELSIIAIL